MTTCGCGALRQILNNIVRDCELYKRCDVVMLSIGVTEVLQRKRCEEVVRVVSRYIF